MWRKLGRRVRIGAVCGESGESSDRGSMVACCRREDFEKEHQKFGRGIGIAW